MKRYIRSDSNFHKYDNFADAIEDNKVEILSLAKELDIEAYKHPDKSVFIEIDLDGELYPVWLTGDKNSNPLSGIDEITYTVFEISHQGQDEQNDLEEIYIDNFIYNHNNEEIRQMEQMEFELGYQTLTDLIEDKFPEELAEVKNSTIEMLAQNDCYDRFPDMIDNAIKEARNYIEEY